MDLVAAAERRDRLVLWSEECMVFAAGVTVLAMACVMQGWSTDYWMDMSFPAWLVYELPRALLFALAGPAFLLYHALEAAGAPVGYTFFFMLCLAQYAGLWWLGKEYLMPLLPQRRWSAVVVACGLCGAAAMSSAPPAPAWKTVPTAEQEAWVDVVLADWLAHGGGTGVSRLYLSFGIAVPGETKNDPTSRFLERFASWKVQVFPGSHWQGVAEAPGAALAQVHLAEARECPGGGTALPVRINGEGWMYRLVPRDGAWEVDVKSQDASAGLPATEAAAAARPVLAD